MNSRDMIEDRRDMMKGSDRRSTSDRIHRCSTDRLHFWKRNDNTQPITIPGPTHQSNDITIDMLQSRLQGNLESEISTTEISKLQARLQGSPTTELLSDRIGTPGMRERSLVDKSNEVSDKNDKSSEMDASKAGFWAVKTASFEAKEKQNKARYKRASGSSVPQLLSVFHSTVPHLLRVWGISLLWASLAAGTLISIFFQ